LPGLAIYPPHFWDEAMLCFECVAHFAGPVDGGHGDYGYDYGYDDGGYGGYGYEDYGGYGYGGQSCVLLRVLF